MQNPINNILIIADLEGSSGCWNYDSSAFLTDDWCRACLEMSLDVSSVVNALLDAEVKNIAIKDFHRTGYNLFPELIDPRAMLISGYHRGPVMGVGNPGDAQAVMFLGMHAASGSDGFLAHTLTSRIARLEVNHRLLSEVELFAASVAHLGIRPIFFSGCPVACKQAAAVIKNIHCRSIVKSGGAENFDFNRWRRRLARAAVESLTNFETKPYQPAGPFDATVTMREGKELAVRLARRWGFEQIGDQIQFQAVDMQQLYLRLIRLCYLTPMVENMLPLALMVFNLRGRTGIWRARRRLRRMGRVD